MKARKQTQDERGAALWGCGVRTYRRWRLAGAPVGNPARMRAWLAGQRTLPAGTAGLLEGHQRARRVAADSAPCALPVGVAAALVRLEGAEARSFQALETALARGDAAEVRATREGWLRVSESLRKYDLAVAEARRDAGELVQRSDAEQVIENTVRLIRSMGKVLAGGLAARLVIVHDVIEAEILIRDAFAGAWGNAIAGVRSWELAHHPETVWGSDAAVRAFRNAASDKGRSDFDLVVETWAPAMAAFILARLKPADAPPAPTQPEAGPEVKGVA